MAGNRRVITLGLDNSEFNASAAECQRRMRLLDAEFRQTAEEMRLNSTEADQLQARQDYLTQRIRIQTERVQSLRDAYQNANSTQGTTRVQLDRMRITLAQQETALARMNNELQETTNATEEVRESTGSFGDSIRNVSSMLGLEANPAVEAFASKFDGVNKSVGEAVLAIGTIVTALGSLTVSTAKAADDIATLATTTGLTTDKIQEFNYAADFMEISAEDLGSSLAKMTKNMSTARKGTGDAAEAFKTLGVRIKDNKGHLLDSEQVFYKTIDALGKIKSETERDALSMAIFGKSATSLNTLIEMGSKGLKKYTDEAQSMGYVMDEETVKSFGNLNDSMDKFNKQVETVKMKLGIVLLPVLQAVFDVLDGIPTPVLVGISVFGMLAVIAVKVATAVKTVAVANALLSATNATVGATGAVATAGMAPLVIVLLAIAAAIALITGGITAFVSASNSMKNSVTDTTNTLSASMESARSTATNVGKSKIQNHASGTKNFNGGRTWVGENGPELVDLPQGSRIHNAEESANMIGNTNNYYNITIEARSIQEFNDIVRIVQSKQQSTRRGLALT